MYDYEVEREKREKSVIDGMQYLETFVNSSSFNDSKMADLIVTQYLNMHRTLQQSLIRLIYGVIKRLGRYYELNPNAFDLRNEGAKTWIQKVAKIEDSYFPFV